MNKSTLVRTVRLLDRKPLDLAEITDLAEGAPPSNIHTLDGLDCEELITHLSKRLLAALEELSAKGGDL